MRRYIIGELLDSLNLWFVVCLLMLFAFLIWGAVQIQDHYYFATTPFTWQGVKVP
jgi:hypothetical protein